MNEWEDNHGEIPKGVTHDCRLDIEYRDGNIMHNQDQYDDPDLWLILNDDQDIIRWRFA